MRIQKLTQKNRDQIIKEAKQILSQGGIVVYPSDTVYGLLVDSTSDWAVENLINIKSRPAGRAISVFVSDFLMMEELVKIHSKGRNRLKELLPGPYTIVLPSKHKVSPLLESEKGSLGVRLPYYKLITDLVAEYGKPLTATSANLSGRSPCYSIEAFMNQLSDKNKNKLGLAVDAGTLPRNKPSTVLDFTGPIVQTLRKGDSKFSNATNQISTSVDETKKIAKGLLKNQLNKIKNKPLIFILEGELGSGKTVFVKAIGEELEIDNIISPTFVIYYEYDIKNEIGERKNEKLIHVDLYNLQDKEEFEHLGLERYLKPGNILCIEWGEKVGVIYDTLRKNARIVRINILHKGLNKRQLLIND